MGYKKAFAFLLAGLMLMTGATTLLNVNASTNEGVTSATEEYLEPKYSEIVSGYRSKVYIGEGLVYDVSTIVSEEGEQFKTTEALDRPAHSWAAAAENRVNIYMITLAPEAELIIPASTASATRFCYFYQGKSLELEGQKIQVKHLIELKPDQDIHTGIKALVKNHWEENTPLS